jgi:HK97 family phage prohead protease
VQTPDRTIRTIKTGANPKERNRKTMKRAKNLTFKNIEIRGSEQDGGERFVEGLIPYDSKSVPMWGVTEIIARTAFNKTLADKAEVRALVSHDDGKILGSTKSGTLELENSDKGLVCRCRLPDTSYARDLFEVVRRGDVTTMSFGFIPVKWDDDAKKKTRTVREAALKEISFGVAFPAYPETNSNTFVRKINMDLEKLNALLEKEELTEAELKELQSVVEELNSVIAKHTPKEDGEEETEAAEREQPGGAPGGSASGKGSSGGGASEEGGPGGGPKDKEEIKKELLVLIDLLFALDENPEPDEPEPEQTEEETA